MKKGQLLVETIIGVGVIGILLSAIIPLFLVGVKGTSETGKSDVAKMLTQETVEAAKQLKEENWNNIYRVNKAVPYHIEKNVDSWQIIENSETVNLNNISFNRQIIIDNVSRTIVNGAGEIEETYNALRDDPSTQKITVTVAWPGSTGISSIDYFSRWANSRFLQTDWSGGSGAITWQDPPANKFYSTTTNFVPSGDIDSVTVPGSLRLGQIPGGGAVPYGNEFVSNSVTTIYRLNNPAYRLAMRFTAQKSGSVNQLRFYIHAVSRGNQVYYRYGLQADNPLNPGNPSGTYISSATANFSATGWQTVNLPSPAAVTAGGIYYFVVQYDSGSPPAGNRYIDIRSTSPVAGIVPQNDQPDPAANTLRYNGVSWQIRNSQPLYVLGFNDGTFEGNPYDNRATRSIYGNNFEGETFSLPMNKTVSGVGLYMALSSNQEPNDSLYVTLQDITAGTTLINNETFLATPTGIGTTFAWRTHNFNSAVNLTAGSQYRLYFSSPGSSSNRNYLMLNVSNPNSAPYNDINWLGANAFTTRSANGGLNFTDSPFIDLSYYLLVSGSLYALNGEIISSSLDSGNSQGGGFHYMVVNLNEALNANTKVYVQLAANNDNITWNYQGPAGTGGPLDWYELATGETTHSWNIRTGLYDASTVQPSRYLRYKIRLVTTDQTITPKVDLIKINWSK
ncbi:MAG: hypothetical protein US94_C0008G0008 [Berkelbacteria bacterium GW2011_GWB1_38_5]|uniref:DUF4082 domain-containing protein n=1 Tax=Berkelbacteria bacterium GW2011_GWB1_38_5 TaxID=1618336 RepID=A0A0G0K3K1_9BACT|nr:MAG: hypothetical protein US94_C0008G0008 [Berkelbacteria bacterium GW2011_GWB1_38_5]